MGWIWKSKESNHGQIHTQVMYNEIISCLDLLFIAKDKILALDIHHYHHIFNNIGDIRVDQLCS